MFKRLALTAVFVAGCTVPPGTTAPKPGASPVAANPSTSSASPAPTPKVSLVAYDGGDFQIAVPEGWTQTAKDQPLTKSINRCTFRQVTTDGKTPATLIVTSGTITATTLAEQYGFLKAATLQAGETVTAEGKNDAGEAWGLRSTTTGTDGTFVNFRFVVVGTKALYLIGMSTRQGGGLTDDMALQIASSFTLK